MILFTLILIALSAICKAICDTLMFHFTKSIFSRLKNRYWFPSISWKNKYKKDFITSDIIYPLEPRFPGSTTFLVWLTDAWHLFGTFQIILNLSAIVCATNVEMGNPIAVLIVLYVLYCFIFELFFGKLFKK